MGSDRLRLRAQGKKGRLPGVRSVASWPAMVTPLNGPLPERFGQDCDYDHKNLCGLSRQKTDKSDRLGTAMDQFGVLTNRKRAVIALIHSVVFLGVASCGFVSLKFGIDHDFPWSGRATLFRRLRHQRVVRVSANDSWGPGSSSSPIHTRAHAELCGRDRVRTCSILHT